MFGTGYLLQMLRDSENNDQTTKKRRSSPCGSDKSGHGVVGVPTVDISGFKSITDAETPTVKGSDPELTVEAQFSSNEHQPEEETEQCSIEESSECIKENAESTPSATSPGISYDFHTTPRLLLKEETRFVSSKFGDVHYGNNFLKGCKWSPDGSCLLTNSEDRRLRVFSLPNACYNRQFYDEFESRENANNGESLNLLSSMASGELTYDYCWYPLMNSSIPESCVYVQTARDHPIQMCDASTGRVCASYLPINHLDEVSCAHSLTFNPDGSRLYAGFNKTIRIFDTYRPGRQLSTKSTWKKRHGGQSGIISCIAVCPTMPSLYACGSYGRTVATYSEDFEDGPLSLAQLEDTGGITHILYHPNGYFLFSGGRMDNRIVCWDMRVPGKILASYQRHADTNQRFYFDLDWSGRYLVSGGSNGEISVWDISGTPDDNGVLEPIITFQAHTSAANGAALNPFLPVLATSSGQRLFPSPLTKVHSDVEVSSEDEEDECQQRSSAVDNSVKLWLVGRFKNDASDDS